MIAAALTGMRKYGRERERERERGRKNERWDASLEKGKWNRG
jgi:hypothetical protein